MAWTVTPLGYLTEHYRDALGRDTLVLSSIRADSSAMRQTVAYDVMDRDTLSVTYGRAMTLSRVSGVARLNVTDAEAVSLAGRHDTTEEIPC